jgi:hypothetical protein
MVERWIDSYGTMTGYGLPGGQLSKQAVDALVTAAATLEVSSAGYDTMRGPNQHLMSYYTRLETFGPSRAATLVGSLVDGQTAGYRETVSSRDPAASEPRKYACGEL